jgi:CRISPR system Cascade subunit CasC
MLVQIHILQNYAPSNLNRDDTGSPKDCLFGGYRRGRISSQCLKRSIRKSTVFAEAFAKDNLLGMRTKKLYDLLREELQALNVGAEDLKNIVARVAEIGRESSKTSPEEEAEPATSAEEQEPEVETAQLIFIGRDEVRPLAEKLLALYNQYGQKKWLDSKKLKIGDITKALGKSLPRSVDIAMFGRMTTSEAFEDVQAAVQVAHALSTNPLTQEFDYYTAVDDLSGESGAGMIGDIEFNSSTYYKYLSVHWEMLVENLGGDSGTARRAVLALIQAAATAQPSGKQNSFAANNLPDIVLVEVTNKNLPVSYANAFLKPARPDSRESLMDDSMKKLGDYVARVTKTYGLEGKRAFTATQDYTLPEAQCLPSLSTLQEWVGAQLPEA